MWLHASVRQVGSPGNPPPPHVGFSRLAVHCTANLHGWLDFGSSGSLTETVMSHAFLFHLPSPFLITTTPIPYILRLIPKRPHGSLPQQHYAAFTKNLRAHGFNLTSNLVFLKLPPRTSTPLISVFSTARRRPGDRSLTRLMNWTSVPASPWEYPLPPRSGMSVNPEETSK